VVEQEARRLDEGGRLGGRVGPQRNRRRHARRDAQHSPGKAQLHLPMNMAAD